jgi:hypothetical protein
MDGGNEIWDGPKLVTEGEWAGWRTWAGMDAFEDQTGPFYFKEDNGVVRSAFRAEARHMNGGGFMHGGCMMTFADYSLFSISWAHLKDRQPERRIPGSGQGRRPGGIDRRGHQGRRLAAVRARPGLDRRRADAELLGRDQEDQGALIPPPVGEAAEGRRGEL